jgi:hypothetical protein
MCLLYITAPPACPHVTLDWQCPEAAAPPSLEAHLQPAEEKALAFASASLRMCARECPTECLSIPKKDAGGTERGERAPNSNGRAECGSRRTSTYNVQGMWCKNARRNWLALECLCYENPEWWRNKRLAPYTYSSIYFHALALYENANANTSFWSSGKFIRSYSIVGSVISGKTEMFYGINASREALMQTNLVKTTRNSIT